MKLSTRGRYATRAMLYLAHHFGEGSILIKDISKEVDVSEQYLEQLFIPLRTAGLARAIRGAHGGFSLAKKPQEIKLSQIIMIMEGSTAPAECVDDAGICSRADWCVTREVWTELKKAMNGVLESTTLQDLVERQAKKVQPKETLYYI